MVFAPHFDDETLGCGGTVLRKKQAGADVKIAFMMDCGQSHQGVMSPDEIKEIRRREGLAACRQLGLSESDVFLLNQSERGLVSCRKQAMEAVAALLKQQQPEEVFVPYYRDVHPDHVATNAVVRTVLDASGARVTVFEYPIWFWRHWPWVGLPLSSRGQAIAIIKSSIFSRLGLRMLLEFTCTVRIADVLQQKLAAMQQHRSQLTRLKQDARWPTLRDIDHGEFLKCFMQKNEVFHRYTIG